ncbi:hypothetical protein SSS_00610 [Sarcoptes scabiei]|nr:hypothetical protein SSS_00610 [Sarcoptes scabiei]
MSSALNSEIHTFGVDPITTHAFDYNNNRLAVSPNNNEVHIYHREDGKWLLNSSLSQHDLRVTSIDWAKKTNRIVTCSADRNGYVWTLVDGVWKPTLVLLRINRAATCVRWSPKEDKFAVGCGAKLISVCYFDEKNDWWVSKHIKKSIRSTVNSIDWHPNNVLLACGSTDFRTRVFSAYLRDVDANINSETVKATWNGTNDMGTLLSEFHSSQGGWVYCVAFSPDGTRLAWVSHDSSVSIVDSKKSMHPINVRTTFLPFLSCVWSSDNLLVTAGHDCCPMLYCYDDYSGEIRFLGKIDKSLKKEADGFRLVELIYFQFCH